MEERTALMAAVIASPDDDAPRLVLADWLEEHGDESECARAEVIRLQCRVATLPIDDPSRAELGKREKDLADRHWQDWLGPLRSLQGADAPWMVRSWEDPTPEFQRGLLRSYITSAGRFLKKAHQKAACEGFPVVGVNELHLQESTKRAALLAQSHALAWVPRLQWNNARAEDDTFVALAGSPHLAHLSSLVIEKPHCSDAGLKAIAKSSALPRLRTFGLRNGEYGGKYSLNGVLHVLNSPWLPFLDELDLTQWQPIDFKSASLFADPGLSRLKRLALGRGTSMSHLAPCPHLTKLEQLSVEQSRITHADAEALAGNPALANLRQVTLSQMFFSSARPLTSRAEELLRQRFGNGLTLDGSWSE